MQYTKDIYNSVYGLYGISILVSERVKNIQHLHILLELDSCEDL